MAAHTIVMTIEGILAGKDDDVELSQTPLEPLGHIMYAAFGAASRLVLATKLERRLVDHWCRLNGLTRHATVIGLDQNVIRRLRAAGESPDLYIDWNGDRVAQAVKDGVVTMLFVKPLYARAGFQRTELPGLQRPWASVLAEHASQQQARALPVPEDD